MRFIATCLFGLEKLLGDEIDALGYTRVNTIDGRVEFEAPPQAIAGANIFLRHAERVLIQLGSFRAESFTALFDGTAALPWEDFIGRDDAFPVKGHAVKSKLFSVPDCQRIVKKSIVERLRAKHRTQSLPESGISYQIVFFLLNDIASLMIDTTGEPLHKRGYRTEGNLAPIRETLAASMVKLARPRENVLLVDPMCGSGTIPIESALIATGTAPGIRRRFDCEQFSFVEKSWFAEAREKARAAVHAPEFPIYGFDIDPSAVALSRQNAQRAGMQDYIVFEERDARKFVSPVENARGTIVCNPPYGERMSDLASVRLLEQAVGKALAEAVPMWQLYFISSDEEFERNFGRRADKVRRLYNGMIRCNFYQFFRPMQNAKLVRKS